MTPEQRLRQLKIELLPVAPPIANYVNAVRTGNLLFLAGKGPAGGVTGIVGKDITLEQAYQHARSTGLALIAVMKDELGSLERVKRIVKVLGMVNAVPGFPDQPKVINGCSDLFVEVFGAAIGRHARSAVGMGSLPLDFPGGTALNQRRHPPVLAPPHGERVEAVLRVERVSPAAPGGPHDDDPPADGRCASIAAGAVLVMAIGAALCGLIVLVPPLLQRFGFSG